MSKEILARNHVRLALSDGDDVTVANDVVQSNLRHLRANADLLPDKVVMVTPVKISPLPGAKIGSVPELVHVTLLSTDRKSIRVTMETEFLLTSRAFALGGDLIGLVTLDPSHKSVASLGDQGARNLAGRIRAAIAHEGSHIRRQRGTIPTRLWARLLDHAENLLILERDVGEIERLTGAGVGVCI